MVERIIPLDDDVRQSREFASKANVRIYLGRARITEEKARNDIFIGKIAEFAVARSIPGCSMPDVTIHEKPNWGADLKLPDGTKVHVKTQSVEQGLKYGTSWIFERKDRGVKSKKPGIGAFCVTNADGSVNIHAIVPVQYLHDNELFKPTKLKFKDKVAIYAEDLVNCPRFQVLKMELVYNLSGVVRTNHIDNVSEAYEAADYHRKMCKEGDSLRVVEEKTPSVGIKFYNRKGLKVYSVTDYHRGSPRNEAA
jgi:hypothetical protein